MHTDLDQSVYTSATRQPQPEGSLFDSFEDAVLRRVDDVVAGRNCQWPTKETHRRLLALLRNHQGKGRAVPLGLIGERMSLAPRAVKELVQDLRMSFGVLIGSSRDADGGGYYLMATEEECDETCAPYFQQAITELRVVHCLQHGRQSIAELTRQIELALSGDTR